MQIRSILVHLDPGLASVTRLTLAHGLAERLDAELTLLFGSAGEAASPAFAYSASAALHAAQESEAGNGFARASYCLVIHITSRRDSSHSPWVAVTRTFISRTGVIRPND